ncbi:23S rRNA m(1)G-745 methyltransferase [Oceanospirillum multiglobuliferum]|uniref:rRNA (Guanine-N1)-methyltransferase n=1 Tax=Oceanospirillum multiglobuliferum TaxID=64969 RepID=A0A1T4LGU9_9GAMM|nr:methyltransferase domain-containing protein [Oceanospirillum multiglobuliferum]OPX56662.1 rRNA (guanine-N1)-methyltransferase [Oceanospirillum multiglobuliferum]SJZ54012.1 23S rRNA m(1)G-745 methyltransferase [Oceanospirillum multiglobuliferum]
MPHQIAAQNLICPLDQLPLSQVNNSLCCPSGHTFDLAKQGYVNLLPVQKKRSKDPGDSKEMVLARQRYLDAGIYQPISERLNQICQQILADSIEPCVIDAGCGEGYYLNRLASIPALASANLIGLDISKWAVQAASKRNKKITWLVGTNAQIPVQPNSVDLIVCTFGFYDFARFKPLLKANGMVLLVESGEEHLIELRELIYPEVQRSNVPDLAAAYAEGFELVDQQSIQFKPNTLNHEQVTDLLVMTPHLYRASFEGKQKAAALTELSVTADVVYRLLKIKPKA